MEIKASPLQPAAQEPGARPGLKSTGTQARASLLPEQGLQQGTLDPGPPPAPSPARSPSQPSCLEHCRRYLSHCTLNTIQQESEKQARQPMEPPGAPGIPARGSPPGLGLQRSTTSTTLNENLCHAHPSPGESLPLGDCSSPGGGPQTFPCCVTTLHSGPCPSPRLRCGLAPQRAGRGRGGGGGQAGAGGTSGQLQGEKRDGKNPTALPGKCTGSVRPGVSAGHLQLVGPRGAIVWIRSGARGVQEEGHLAVT